jgi:3-phosphoglycerate kinase
VPDFRTLDDVDLRGKRVLLRVDLNVPMTDDGEVSDSTCIERMAPTVAEIAEKGGKVILLSHFGRPKGRSKKDSLRPAQGKAVGMSLCERDLADSAQHILATAQAHHCQVVLPVDAVVAKAFKARGPSRVVEIDAVGPDDMILDIGPRTVEQVISVLGRVKTLVWNGPFGTFELEPFEMGTIEVAEAAAELTAAGKLVSVAGGGDKGLSVLEGVPRARSNTKSQRPSQRLWLLLSQGQLCKYPGRCR